MVRSFIFEPFREAETLSAISLLDAILASAYARAASDIHLDPEQDEGSVCMRIDGVLHRAYSLPGTSLEGIISRLKVLAGLRTDEHHTPQDGRVVFHLQESDVAVRVSIAPTYFGENAVLRIHHSVNSSATLQSLGMPTECEEYISRTLSRHGLFLTTGPTGSGKTTTLYAIVNILKARGMSIITIEDPVECTLPGVRQMQVAVQTGFTYAEGLRAVLRQDPDVIMVGEIRDAETAQLAVQAALTGHTVLATLHAGSAYSSIERLIGLGVERYMLASTLRLVLSQRLSPKPCMSCQEWRDASSEEQALLERIILGSQAYENVVPHNTGCERCSSTGVSGRTGLFEMLCMNPEREQVVRSGISMDNLYVEKADYTFADDALHKFTAGALSLSDFAQFSSTHYA